MESSIEGVNVNFEIWVVFMFLLFIWVMIVKGILISLL